MILCTSHDSHDHLTIYLIINENAISDILITYQSGIADEIGNGFIDV